MLDVLITSLLVLCTLVVVGMIGLLGAFFSLLIVRVWRAR